MIARSIALTLSLALLAPQAALAQHHGGGPGGGPGRAAPAPRGPAGPPGGFNFNRDINASRPPANAQRPPVSASRPPIAGRQPGRGPHVAIANPRFRGQRAWNWNRGVAWAPAPHYWGGGFWGPFSLGAAAVAIGAIAFGTFDDPDTNEVYTSYQVGPDSPGATMLSNYGLTQTPCGPPNLVVIFGPDTSAICAFPNDTVAPGEYTLDPSTLSIESQ